MEDLEHQPARNCHRVKILKINCWPLDILLQKDLKFMSAICFIVCIISKKVRLAMLVRMASSDIGMAECKQRDQMTELKV